VASAIAASPTNATNAANSATAAATSATNASNSASAAATSAASAASAYDTFDDRYLGSKTSNPSVDNDGNSLVTGALYFNSSANEMRVYDGANWIAASSAGTASMVIYEYTASSNQTSFSGSDNNSATLSYSVGNLQVVLNGIVLDPGDFTATNGTAVVLAAGAAANDILNVYAFKSFTVSELNANNLNDGTIPDARFPATLPAVDGSNLTGITSVGGAVGVDFNNDVKARFGASNELQIYKANGGNSYIQETGTSNLRIAGTEIFLRNGADTENLAVFRTNGANELYYDNSKKLETTSTGVEVSGVDDSNNLIVGNNNTNFAVYTDGTVGEIRLKAEDGSSSNFAKFMTFYTQSAGSVASERMRIDSSGNVLVGKTSADSGGSVGTELLSGRIFLRRSGGAPLIADRDTSNGDIILLRRAGTNVGILGGVGTELFLGSNAGSGSYLNFGSNRIIPASNTGGNRDNVINLGNSASRFSDLYLGGNIYLGGTGSANALDDYEEGTWTPTIANMSVSGSFSASGRYVKVGKMVLAYGTFSATGSIAYGGSGLLGSFPFQGAVTDNGTVTYVSLSGNSASGGIGLGDFISSRFFFKNDFTTTGSNQKTTFTAIYEAN
jgi:hypothetical protein